MSRHHSTTIHWLLQSSADVSVGAAWLTDAEHAVLSRFRFAARRTEWRLGRWTAKRAVALASRGMQLAPRRVAILPSESGGPEVSVDGVRVPLALSLSHSDGHALCALAFERGAVTGCDVEPVMRELPPFLEDYLTPDERFRVESAPIRVAAELATVFWSAKESALKALGTGLRTDPRTVRVVLGDDDTDERDRRCDWRRLRVRIATGGDVTFDGWWRRLEDLVLVVVARGAVHGTPVALGEQPRRPIRTRDSRRRARSAPRPPQRSTRA